MRDGLVDRAFVDAWCHGFKELEEQVAAFTPEHVAQVCDVPAEDVVRAAHLFGEARAAALVSGRASTKWGRTWRPRTAPFAACAP